MATAKAKPDGYFHISPESAIEYLDPLPVRSLPGVGYNTVEKLGKLGIATFDAHAVACGPEGHGREFHV